MRITHDPEANAAYIRLTDLTASGHHSTTRADTPDGINTFIALDWDDGHLIGIEILDASHRLPADFLEQAEQLT